MGFMYKSFNFLTYRLFFQLIVTFFFGCCKGSFQCFVKLLVMYEAFIFIVDPCRHFSSL